MSSIKQVQDLEKQIERVRRENNTLKRLLNDRDGQMDLDVEGVDQLAIAIPEIGSEPKRRKRAAPLHDPSRARTNVRNISKGLFKPPAPYRPTPVAALPEYGFHHRHPGLLRRRFCTLIMVRFMS
ncbi:hypothetical protein PG994_001594 [Apiospora phragmitis]|uniref:Uncharacterized protein n=1 Tax=Apiospora phragmitis TaxID=2905665 RepID=A0ABR1WTW9_9PEZI